MSLYSEQIDALLSVIAEQASQGNANIANQSLERLNKVLEAWCGSTEPPSQTQLKQVQINITQASSAAVSQREKIQTELLNQRQSNKAISKYKSTKP